MIWEENIEALRPAINEDCAAEMERTQSVDLIQVKTVKQLLDTFDS